MTENWETTSNRLIDIKTIMQSMMMMSRHGDDGSPLFLSSSLRLKKTTRKRMSSVPVVVAQFLLSLFLLLSSWSSSSCCHHRRGSVCLLQVEGLKHSFHTLADRRTLIGPVGVPFGFAMGGEYHLTVLDFNLHLVPEKKKKKHKTTDDVGGDNGSSSSSSSSLSDHEILKRIEPGFFLERFPNEAAFHQHLERLRTNATACAFEYFRDHDTAATAAASGGVLANDDDDNFVEVGDITSSEHGILLSMKSRKKWNIGSTPVSESSGGSGAAALNTIQYTFQKPSEQGLYFLIYQVCFASNRDIIENNDVLLRLQHRVRSTFELDFHVFNVNQHSGKRSYLTAGEMKLPLIFFFFSMSYLVCALVWILNLCDILRGGRGIFHDKTSGKYINLRHAIGRGTGATGERARAAASSSPPPPSLASPTVYKIHHLMAVLLVFKFLSAFFESVRYHAIGILGHAEFWAFVYYLFTFIKGVFLFTVILLIGAGWSFLKPFLNAAEKRVICLVLTLQVVNNIALVILTNETTGEFGFSKWNAILHLVDILCCCAVLIPIVWQVNSLEKSLVGSGVSNNSNSNEEDAVEKQDNHQQLESYEEEEEEMLDVGGENGRVLAKLKLFRSFYLLVVAYIYTTRILVYLFATMLNYKYLWIRYFVIELVTLCFYVVVGLMFRPMVENPYLSLKKDDDNVNEDDDAEEEGIAMQSRTI